MKVKDLLLKVESLEEKVDEQQATISTMTEENKELGKNFEDLVDWASKIANRNVVLDEKIGELQRENKKLKEINRQLREINKELGDDLYNCRLNKNIIREKLKLWQDVHKEYDIYSIKDFEELMKNDK